MSMQLPGVKLIVLLRNPVDRAYSHFQMEKENLARVYHLKMQLLKSKKIFEKYIRKS